MSVRLSVCPSVRMELLGSHWTDFHDILYLNIFRKYIYKIRVSLKSHKNNVYFTQRRKYTYDSNMLEPFLEWEVFRQML